VERKRKKKEKKTRSSRRENLNLVRIDANWSVVLVTSSSFSLSGSCSGEMLSTNSNRFAPFCDYSMLLWRLLQHFSLVFHFQSRLFFSHLFFFFHELERFPLSPSYITLSIFMTSFYKLIGEKLVLAAHRLVEPRIHRPTLLDGIRLRSPFCARLLNN
jgi:hypothetical protein